MTDPVVKFERDGLCIQMERAAGQVTVSWLGVSDSRSPAAFLNPIIEQITRSAAGSPVTIDFTRLEFIEFRDRYAADLPRQVAGPGEGAGAVAVRRCGLAAHALAVHESHRAHHEQRARRGPPAAVLTYSAALGGA